MANATINSDLISTIESQKLFISNNGKLYPKNYNCFPNIKVSEIENFLSFNLDEFISKINGFIGKNPFISNFETIIQMVFNGYIGYAISLEDSDSKIIEKIIDNIEIVYNILSSKKEFKLKQISISAATISFKTSKQSTPYLEIKFSEQNVYHYPASNLDICTFIYKAIRKYKYVKNSKQILKKAIEDATNITFVSSNADTYYLNLIENNYYFKRKFSSEHELAAIFYDSFCIIDRYGDVIVKSKISTKELINDIKTVSQKFEIKVSSDVLKSLLYLNTGLKKYYTSNICFKKWNNIVKSYLTPSDNNFKVGIKDGKIMLKDKNGEYTEINTPNETLYNIIDEFLSGVRPIEKTFLSTKRLISATLCAASGYSSTFNVDTNDELYSKLHNYVLSKKMK